MSHIKFRPDHSVKNLFKHTVAAQLHFAALIAALAGLVLLLRFSSEAVDPAHYWACAVFGISGVSVFAASFIYHFLSDGFSISERLRQFVKDLDHSAIFLFIAGSYTPFIVNVISPPWNTFLMVLIWSIGVTGVSYVFLRKFLPPWARNRIIYTSIFLLMGWTLLIRMSEVLDRLGTLQTFLLVAGGLSYTIGACIYALKWPNPFPKTFGFHEIWHLMVMLGFAFHYFMILNFYIS